MNVIFIKREKISGNFDIVTVIIWCYDKRNEKKNSCDVELITKISIHNYDCRESHCRSWFADDDSLMVPLLIIKEMGSYSNEKIWSHYIQSRPLWVTETSCYHEPS